MENKPKEDVENKNEDPRMPRQKLGDIEIDSLILGMGKKSFRLNREGGWSGGEKSSEAPFLFDLDGNLYLQKVILTAITAPASPPSGQAYIYLDSTSGNLKVKFSNGTVKDIATP